MSTIVTTMGRRHAWALLWVVVGCTVRNPNLGQDETETTTATSGSTAASTSSTSTSTSSSSTSSGTASGSTGSGSTGSGSTGGDTGTSGGSTTGEPDCGPGDTCLPPAPEDWSGPVALLSVPGTDPKPACPAGYTTQALHAFTGLDVPQSTCDCDCDTPMGALCDDVNLEWHSGDDTCDSRLNGWTVGTSCKDISGAVANTWYRADPPPVQGGTCEPVENFTVPPTTWDTQILGCTPDVGADPCEVDGVCGPAVNEASAAGFCIFRSGAFACPPGQPYRAWAEYHEDTTDNRGCEACTCGAPEGTCTGASVTILDDNFCQGLGSGTVLANGNCQQVPGNPESAKAMLGTPDAACTPSSSNPVGMAAPADLVTVCCLPG